MSDWKQSALGQVATLQRGFDLPARIRRRGATPIVSSSGTSGWHDRAMVRAPGVVTGRYGTIGEVFFVGKDFWPLNTTLWVSDFHGNDERFIYYLLQRINFAAHSGKSGVPGVNRNDLHTEVVSLPTSVLEQRAIASALEDSDKLIEALQQLVDKKQAMKLGMMQRFFASKDAWQQSELRQIADVIDPHPSHRAPAETANGIPFLGIGDLNFDGTLASKAPRLVSPNVLAEHAARYDLKDGLIGLGRVASIGKVVRLPKSRRDMAISPTLGVIRPKAVDLDFLYYTLSSAETTEQFRKVMSGSTRASVGMEVLRKLIVKHPSSTDHQQRIGRALADADAEISALRVRLKKARAVKEGMMQELLTGRTRLPVMETAS